MTSAQIEVLREAIACRDVDFDDMIQAVAYSLQEAMQAVDYKDFTAAYNAAALAADVLKTLARR